MRHGSLFSGIGGFDLAAEWAGWTNIFHCEWAEFQRKILDYHFPKAISYEDIKTTDFTPHRGQIDVLTGGFPCFVAGTQVLTSRGFIPIEKVRLGDYVLSTDQKYHEVECLMTHPADDIVYLRAQGLFEELKCTPNHPFYVRRRKTYYKKGRECTEYEAPQYINASELKKGDKVGYPIHEGEDKSFTPAFWKLVGTWIADGWIDNNTRKSKIPQGNRGSRINSRNHKVIICCGKKNISRLHHIIQNAGYRYTLSEERTAYRAIICDKWLCEFLKDFGKRAHGKKLSPQCFKLDNERKKSLFEGWMADGYVENNGSYKVTTVSEELALGMAQIARDAYRCPISLSKKRVNRYCYIEGRLVNERPQYQVTVSNNSKYGFYDNGFVWCNVKTIRTEKEINQVYNLSVNEEHSYNVYGIAVHNCQPFSLAGKRRGADDDRYLWDEMLRAIREIQPTWIVGENVAGLISMAQPGETIGMEIEGSLFGEDNKAVETIRQEYVIETICRDLEREGYSVQPLVIPACAVGAPHRRDRLWIIAHRSDAGTQDLQLGGQDGICESGTSSDSRLLGQKERQELPMGAVKLCEKQSPANTYNIHRDKGWTASGGVTEDSTKRSRILIDTERLGSIGIAANPDSSIVKRQYKYGSRENELDGRDCQEIQACWENFPTQPPICGRDDGFSDRLDGITFPKLRSKSIEGYGNAVVPQVVYEIFKAIERVEYEHRHIKM